MHKDFEPYNPHVRPLKQWLVEHKDCLGETVVELFYKAAEMSRERRQRQRDEENMRRVTLH